MPGCSSGTGSNARQRQESTSSNGSWQVVTDTGSIDSMFNGSYMMRFINQQQQQQQQLPTNSYTATSISDMNVSSNVNGSQLINSSNCFTVGSGNGGIGHTYSIQHPLTTASNSNSNSNGISSGSIGSASVSSASNSLGTTNVGCGFVNGQLSTKISL